MVLLACLAAAAAPQVTITKRLKPTGSAQLEASSSGVVIRYGGREWTVDLSKLPIDPDECEEAGAQQRCAGGGGIACLPCVREWQPVAWDEQRETFYMAASTGTSQNRPWVVLVYDLRTGKLTRLVDYFGGGFTHSGAVSPTGRYLAYVQYDSQGACGTSSSVAVVDTQTRGSRLFRPPIAESSERAIVTAIRWIGPSRLEYDAKVDRFSDCVAGLKPPPRLLTAEIEVTSSVR